MNRRRVIGRLLLVGTAALLVAACSDHCLDVVCSPVPPLLTVLVTDTLTIDTTVYVNRTNPTRIDTVDTTLVVVHVTTDAEVMLMQMTGGDTIIFDTLPPPSAGSVEFTRLDKSGLPDTLFMVRATRGGRTTMQSGLRVQTVEGCCPYEIVGRYTLRLPTVP